MRIKAIQLSWFRGAADPVSLEPDGKSMVVYGVNGSGKSSFVDAVEYVLHNGRIGHLSHEYSGKRHEKAVLNTHIPEGQKAELTITFKDGSKLKTEIEQDGSSTCTGAEAGAMNVWDYRRTVLRQDEVAEFIHDTKGSKYSALLPLLGLQRMEVAAENLRRLAKSVEAQSQLRETKATLIHVETKRKSLFGTDNDDQILTKIQELHASYSTDKASAMDGLSCCKELEAALCSRLVGSSADQRRHIALQAAGELALKDHIDAVRSASVAFAEVVEPLVEQKLGVLQAAVTFAGKLNNELEMQCPACGRSVAVIEFQAHVKAERERLHEIIANFETRKAAIGTLCDTVTWLKSNLSKADVESWRAELANGPLASSLEYLDGISVESIRASCGEEDIKTFERSLLPLIAAAASTSQNAPPDARQLAADTHKAETAKAVFVAAEQAAVAARAEALVSYIKSLESGIREEIRLRSQTVIDEISSDIQAMWAILHPGEAIDDVCLYLPADTDKAIDIALRFHGVKQDSPRLTLSEGYRNSLGLSIFLAMAKREADIDRPLFLDDVVASLDRNHRGMIAELLEQVFSTRQVVILTHDREWYTELRQQLARTSWVFKALLPYETPTTGIRWSHRTTTFGDARAHVEDRPDSAGNDARKIMDVELALIAERLRIKLPFVRADKNDKRMAHEFLEHLIAGGKKCFQKRSGGDYKVHDDAIAAFERADRLLVSWANRASHTFDLVPSEATKLIDSCEQSLDNFRCSSCGKPLWFADAEGSESVQCQCGEIRWRYGKG